MYLYPEEILRTFSPDTLRDMALQVEVITETRMETDLPKWIAQLVKSFPPWVWIGKDRVGPGYKDLSLSELQAVVKFLGGNFEELTRSQLLLKINESFTYPLIYKADLNYQLQRFNILRQADWEINQSRARFDFPVQNLEVATYTGIGNIMIFRALQNKLNLQAQDNFILRPLDVFMMYCRPEDIFELLNLVGFSGITDNVDEAILFLHLQSYVIYDNQQILPKQLNWSPYKDWNIIDKFNLYHGLQLEGLENPGTPILSMRETAIFNRFLYPDQIDDIIATPNQYFSLNYDPDGLLENQAYQALTDPDLVSETFGMMIPISVEMKSEDAIKFYVIFNLRKYEHFYNQSHFRPDPLEFQKRPWEISQILNTLSDIELITYYNLLRPFQSRESYLQQVANEILKPLHWHFNPVSCSNETTDILTGEIRKGTDENPILSFGNLGGYQCYLLDELEAGFYPDETGFRFRIPDAGEEKQHGYYPDQTDFPRSVIVKLYQFLSGNPELQSFRAKVESGLKILGSGDEILNRYRDKYHSLSNSEQLQVQEYLVWMFATGMKMRFWDGMGPYPEWKEENLACETLSRNRDRAVFRQFEERDQILDSMSESLRSWLLSFPRLSYDFAAGNIRLGLEPINIVIDRAQLGQFCLADASNRLVETAYGWLTKFGLEVNETVQEFLNLSPEIIFDPLNYRGTGHREFYLHREDE